MSLEQNTFMSEFDGLELPEVYDLLAAHTANYTKMLPSNYWPSPEFLYNREIIERLQQEIRVRTIKAGFKPQGSAEPPTKKYEKDDGFPEQNK